MAYHPTNRITDEEAIALINEELSKFDSQCYKLRANAIGQLDFLKKSRLMYGCFYDRATLVIVEVDSQNRKYLNRLDALSPIYTLIQHGVHPSRLALEAFHGVDVTVGSQNKDAYTLALLNQIIEVKPKSLAYFEETGKTSDIITSYDFAVGKWNRPLTKAAMTELEAFWARYDSKCMSSIGHKEMEAV